MKLYNSYENESVTETTITIQDLNNFELRNYRSEVTDGIPLAEFEVWVKTNVADRKPGSWQLWVKSAKICRSPNGSK